MFKSYLKQSKALIHSLSAAPKDKVHPINLRFVLGNEAADMDSTFCSLLYGYYRSLINTAADTHYIPVINTQESEIHGRFEIMYLLNNLKYDPADLIFVDQYNIIELAKLNNAEVILVDHNVPSGPIKGLLENVTEILDHHDDKTAVYNEGQIKTKRIEKIGSATTLLFDEMWKSFEDIKPHLEPGIYWLILATILTDTYHFNPKEKGIRWVEKDTWAAETLCKLLKDSKEFPQWLDKEGNVDTVGMFDSLASLKFDVDMNLSLGMEKLFVKDYKMFNYTKGKIGYSVFLINFEHLFGRYSVEEIGKYMKGFKDQEGLTAFVCFFVHPKGKEDQSQMRREMVILWEDEEELEKLTKYLLELKPELKEQPVEMDKKCFRRLLDVTSVYTRKIAEPLIAKYMSEVNASL